MPESLLGKSVGHYRIVEKLGQGGMGVVFKAHDTKLNRDVALKFLPQHLTADDEATARFVREAQAAAAIEHPNICSIHEISETEDGQTYIVMGYYSGVTLRGAMESGEWSVENGDVERVVLITTQILGALDAAHHAGIVHRDIKPGNLIVEENGNVRILDFGLAKLASGIDITKEGSTSGTTAYMSPEQISGEEIDARSDLWSVGVVLYEMLAGRKPFRGDYDQAVVYNILNQEPEPIKGLASGLPEEAAAAIGKALKKNPAERFQTAEEFVGALSPLARPLTGPPTLTDLVRQPKVAVPSAVAVILLALLAWSWYDGNRKVRHAREVTLPAIEQLADEQRHAEAFRLVAEARPFLDDDPTFHRLASFVSSRAWFASEPAGAQVRWKRYGETDDRWTLVGTTPLDSVLFPPETVHLRFEKEGYLPVDRLLPARDRMSGSLDRHLRMDDIVLHKVGSRSDDVVHIPATRRYIALAGLDAMESQSFQEVLMDKYEVTNTRYEAFVRAGGYEDPQYWPELPISFGEAMDRFVDRTGRKGPATWEAGTYPSGTANEPVTGVSWYEAMAFARFKQRSLPTVYHWNVAAWTPLSYLMVPRSNFSKEGIAAVGQYDGIGRYGTFDHAGNAREWIINASKSEQRYILGGGWDDPEYAYNDAYAQDPFDRSLTNGFRTIEYLGEEPNLAALEATIDRPFRDYAAEHPVSDGEFELIRRTYEYDRTPLNVELVSVDESAEGWTRETFSFDASYGGERVRANLFLPRTGEPPFQTIVYFPGSGPIYRREFEDITTWTFDFLLRDGRAFLWPVYKGTFERGGDLTSDWPEETVRYKDYVNMWAKDLQRSVDFLESRDDVDFDRIAYYGLSWGGALGPLMTAVEPRFKASILVVAGLDFRPALPEADVLNFLPHVKTPTLILNGRFDNFFPVETSQRPMFEMLGLPSDQKRLVISDVGHTVTRDVLMREMFEWLDRWLDGR